MRGDVYKRQVILCGEDYNLLNTVYDFKPVSLILKQTTKIRIHPEAVHVAVSGYFFFWQAGTYFSADIIPSSV